MDRLERSDTDKFVFGVCGGIAANLDVDPVLIRAIFVILGFATGGTAIVGYLVLAILMPAPTTVAGSSNDGDAGGDADTPQANGISDNLEQLRREAEVAGARLKEAVSRHRPGGSASNPRRQFWGIIVIVLGILLLGSNLGWYGWLFGLDEWWPVLVIIGGVALLAMKGRGNADRG